MIFKTIITDVKTLGVAIDKINAIMKAQTSLNAMDYSLFGTALDGLSAKQVALALSTKKLSEAQLEEIVKQNDLISKYGSEELIKAGLISINSHLLASEQAVNAEDLKKSLIKKGLTKAQAKEFIQTHLNITADGEETASTVLLTKAMMDEAVQSGIISKEKAQEILSSYGVVTADVAETASKEALTTATWAQVKAQLALMASNPITWITALIGVTYAAVKAYDYFNVTVEEANEALEESKSEYNSVTSDLKSLQDELKTTSDRINELNSKESLSLIEDEELAQLKETSKELEYQIALKKEEQRIAAEETLDDAKDVYSTTVTSDYDTHNVRGSSIGNQVSVTEELENAIEEYKTQEETLEKARERFFELKEKKSKEGLSKGERVSLNHGHSTTIIGNEEQEYEDLKTKITEIEEAMTSASNRAYEMATYVENVRSSLQAVQDGGGMLSSDDLNMLRESTAYMDEYQDFYNYQQGILKNFDKMDVSEQREALVDKLKKSGLTADDAQEIIDNTNDEDLEVIAKISFNKNETKDSVIGAIEEAQKVASNANESDILSTAETLSQIEALSKGLNQLSSIYADVSNKEDFDWSSILNNESFTEAFDNIENASDDFKQSYEEFIQTVSNSPDDIEACQQAFDNLATSYIYNSGALDNLTEETKNATISMLEQMGVANATEMVEARLEAQAYATANGYGNLADITLNDISALLALNTASKTTESYLANLALAKFGVSANSINSQSDVANIIAIANAAGTSSEYVAALTTALQNLQNAQNRANKLQTLSDTMPSDGLVGNAVQGVISSEQETANNDLLSAEQAYEDIMNQIRETRINASDFYAHYTGGSAANADSASTSAQKTMEEIQREWKDYLDKYLALYKAELDSGLIDFDTFLNKSRSMLDDFYRDGKISAKDYWDSVKSLYEDQLSIYDSVLSAVTRCFDNEIDSIRDIIDGLEDQNATLQKQLDEYDSILSVVDDVYDREIDRIREQQDAIDDTISRLQEENDQHQQAIELEKAKYQLYNAQNNRNVKLFNGNEFVYEANQDDIHEAQENLADLELEQTIDALEKQKDALDSQIEKLEEFKEKWAEIANAYDEEVNRQLAIALFGEDYESFILSSRTEDIENFRDNYTSIQQQMDDNQGLIDSYNEKIEYYELLKEQWTAVSDSYKQSQEDQYAAMLLGAQWENEILSGRIGVLNNFKEQYVAIQAAITAAALEAAKAQAEAQSAQSGSTSSGSSSSSGSGGGGGNNSSPPPSDPPASDPHPDKYWVYKQLGSFVTQGEANSKIGMLGGNAVIKVSGDKKPWRVIKWLKGYTTSGEAHAQIGILNGTDVYKRYAKGTTNAEEGWNLVSEDQYGDELIIQKNGNAVIAKGEQLYSFEGGETVINASETRKILSNMDNLIPLQKNAVPLSHLKIPRIDYASMVMNNLHLPNYSSLVPANQNISTSVTIGDIHLHEVQNVDTFANSIIRELPGRIIQKLGK